MMRRSHTPPPSATATASAAPSSSSAWAVSASSSARNALRDNKGVGVPKNDGPLRCLGRAERSKLVLGVSVLCLVVVGCFIVGGIFVSFTQIGSNRHHEKPPAGASNSVSHLANGFHFAEHGNADSSHKAESASSRSAWQQQGDQAARQKMPPPPSASSSSAAPPSKHPLRIHYIVTSMHEFETGKRGTQKGQDRYQNTIIPVVTENVRSMIQTGYTVDVTFISDYTLPPQRQHLLQQSLAPYSVHLTFWGDATPVGYKMEDVSKEHAAQHITRGLARQHRFVIKDRLQHYDFFACFEDDMVVKGATIRHYVDMEAEIYRLRQLAHDTAPNPIVKLPAEVRRQFGDRFFGTLTKEQLKRVIPGFIRVEVLLDEDAYGAQEELDPVPVTDRPQIDPNPCCSMQDASETRPASPRSDQLVLWETNIKALGVRRMPPASKLFDWVLLQRGPRYFDWELYIADYWSNRHNKYYSGAERPDEKEFLYINNQGGWMATRRQIWEWHTDVCLGGFLPPFDAPDFRYDGLDMRNVEYWSGALQLFTREHGCNLQRIISLNPDHVAKQLLYHSSNNKQRQLHKRRFQIVKVNDLFGQLNTVQQDANQMMDSFIQTVQQYWAKAQ